MLPFSFRCKNTWSLSNPTPCAMLAGCEDAELVRFKCGHTYLRSAKLPTKVPMIIEEPKPAMKS